MPWSAGSPARHQVGESISTSTGRPGGVSIRNVYVFTSGDSVKRCGGLPFTRIEMVGEDTGEGNGEPMTSVSSCAGAASPGTMRSHALPRVQRWLPGGGCGWLGSS